MILEGERGGVMAGRATEREPSFTLLLTSMRKL